MKKFRKKPVEIEAIQFIDKNILEIVNWITETHSIGFENDSNENITGLIIPTLEGDMKASIGDYIIKGVKGEFYPCKPDIFEQTYELVND